MVIHVGDFDDLEEACRAYRSGVTVELWLDTAIDATGHRAIDVASGMVYVTDGIMTKLGERRFRLVPVVHDPLDGGDDRAPRRPQPPAGGPVAALPVPANWERALLPDAPVSFG